MSPTPGQVPGLVARAAAGDREAIVELLARHLPRPRRMVALRLDPEILVLRPYEPMTNGDAAAALGLSFEAASKRSTRALERLEEILNALPGDLSGPGA